MYARWYLRKKVVYLPTLGRTGNGISIIDEPVAVVPVSDTRDLKRAFLETFARGNPAVPEPPIDGPQDFALLKYAGVKSVAAFDRGTQTWRLSDHGGSYRIIASKRGRIRGWEDDPDNTVTFPLGIQLDEVIDRAIDILQAAASSS